MPHLYAVPVAKAERTPRQDANRAGYLAAGGALAAYGGYKGEQRFRGVGRVLRESELGMHNNTAAGRHLYGASRTNPKAYAGTRRVLGAGRGASIGVGLLGAAGVGRALKDSASASRRQQAMYAKADRQRVKHGQGVQVRGRQLRIDREEYDDAQRIGAAAEAARHGVYGIPTYRSAVARAPKWYQRSHVRPAATIDRKETALLLERRGDRERNRQRVGQAALGGVTGAAVGASLGGIRGRYGRGALIGGALGAGAGAAASPATHALRFERPERKTLAKAGPYKSATKPMLVQLNGAKHMRIRRPDSGTESSLAFLRQAKQVNRKVQSRGYLPNHAIGGVHVGDARSSMANADRARHPNFGKGLVPPGSSLRVTARTPSGRFVSHENDLKVIHIRPKRRPTSELRRFGKGIRWGNAKIPSGARRGQRLPDHRAPGMNPNGAARNVTPRQNINPRDRFSDDGRKIPNARRSLLTGRRPNADPAPFQGPPRSSIFPDY